MNLLRIPLCLLLLLVAQQVVIAKDSPSKFTLSEQADGVTVKLHGELFTRYLTKSGPRPVLWPVIGPTGQPITRAYPVGESQVEEAHDHVHHRSIWVGYEGVNGIDYWHEPTAGVTRPYPIGKQVHREFVVTQTDGQTATIVTTNDWLDHQGEKVCHDQRTWVFGGEGDGVDEVRWLDCRLELTASEGELRLADSKEGFFAVRVADSMNVDHGETGGRIVTSRGLTDAAAWGKPAEWVDYQGPVAGKQVGIAIFTHPKSLNYPTPWHVRTYGLFASNPLGKIAFTEGAPDVRRRPVRMTLPAGESLVLRYRILLHQGDEKQAKLAERYVEYTNQ